MGTSSESLEGRAEVLKLASLLGCDPRRLEYLVEVAPEDLRLLREQATEMLFSAHSGTLGRLASASRLIPVPIVATIGERAFGAVLSARMAALVDPDRAVSTARRLSTPFLAEVAVEMDPRRSSLVIGRIAPEQIAAVAAELVRRREFVTMGRFIGHLPDESLAAAIGVIDAETLLRVGFVLEDPAGLDRVVAILSDERLAGLIEAARDARLWPEALVLLSRLSDANQQRFARLEVVRQPDVLEEIVRVAREQDLWSTLAPLIEPA